MTRAPKVTETQEHRAIADHFRKTGFRDGTVAFHIKNDQTTRWQRLNAAKMGLLPGVPDWCFVHRGQVGFIELKERGWRNSKAKLTTKEIRQLETQWRLERAGAWVEICETLEEVLAALKAHGISVRAEPAIIEGLRASLAETEQLS